MTHCNNLADAVAFNDMLVLGIDIEKINKRVNRGIEAELTQYEKNLAYRVSHLRGKFPLMVWKIKE
ncbi:MAG: hypothetical protein N3B21_14200 [Clostridia bacterium]|nr:hypothetical protein [Clostridia bacterium]